MKDAVIKYFFLLLSLLSGIVLLSSLGFSSHDQEKNPHPLNQASKEKTIWGITEDQLDQLFETSNDYIALSDARYFHRLNEKWTHVLGWTLEELKAMPFIALIHPEDLPATIEAAQNLGKGTCTVNFENRYRTKKGDYHRLQWFALAQVSGNDKSSHTLSIIKDLTLEQRAQHQKYILEQAEAATRLKSSFVTHMSHEIRTPLNGVMGFLDLALEEKMSEQVRSYIQNAQESSRFLLGIANDIIDVSKIESNVLKIDHSDFNPYAVVKSVVSLLTPQAQKKSLAFKSSVVSDLPPVLRGDENRLKQILINLVGNALKFTLQGHVSLKIKGYSQGGTTSNFLLQGQIKDTGIGIEPEFISKLFQPFSQEDHSMRRQFGGAGLGLYITKQLCERMGGTINVASTPGLGTLFQFHVICEEPPLRSPGILRKVTSSLESTTLPLMPSKVLIVEDNRMNQKVATILLKKLGCDVDIAEDGQQGLKAVRQKTYDLVLMDGEMPVMDGLQATEEIRKLFSKQQLPIIGLSAHAMSTHRDQFLEAGMNGYLTKPISREALTQEISRCFQWLSTNKSS